MADVTHRRRQHMSEQIVVKVNRTSLPPGFWQILADALYQAPAGV